MTKLIRKIFKIVEYVMGFGMGKIMVFVFIKINNFQKEPPHIDIHHHQEKKKFWWRKI